MSTKRRIIRRSPRPPTQFTKAALDAFRKMHAVECTCPPRGWKGKYWEHTPCAGCEEWWEQHLILHKELGLNGIRDDWPAIVHPHARSPYPEGCYADQHWKSEAERRLGAQQRYRALAAAAGIEIDEEE